MIVVSVAAFEPGPDAFWTFAGSEAAAGACVTVEAGGGVGAAGSVLQPWIRLTETMDAKRENLPIPEFFNCLSPFSIQLDVGPREPNNSPTPEFDMTDKIFLMQLIGDTTDRAGVNLGNL